MKKQRDLRRPLLFGVCAFLILAEIVSTASVTRSLGITAYQYYTTDSNVLAGLSALLLFIFEVRGGKIPKWVRLVRFMATLCLTVTFLVVVFLLIPMNGGKSQIVPLLFEGAMLFHHLLCPLVSLASFLFLEKTDAFTRIDTLIALIPTLIYGGIFIPLNILRVTRGPYPFLYVYEQPVYMSVLWAVVIIGGAYGLACGIFSIGHRKKGV